VTLPLGIIAVVSRLTRTERSAIRRLCLLAALALVAAAPACGGGAGDAPPAGPSVSAAPSGGATGTPAALPAGKAAALAGAAADRFGRRGALWSFTSRLDYRQSKAGQVSTQRIVLAGELAPPGGLRARAHLRVGTASATVDVLSVDGKSFYIRAVDGAAQGWTKVAEENAVYPQLETAQDVADYLAAARRVTFADDALDSLYRQVRIVADPAALGGAVKVDELVAAFTDLFGVSEAEARAAVAGGRATLTLSIDPDERLRRFVEAVRYELPGGDSVASREVRTFAPLETLSEPIELPAGVK
jgi:hypothetical protein